MSNCKVLDDNIYPLCKDPEGNVVTTKELQKKLLIIMDEIHRVCVKNNIPYALEAGSALGIYNYEGFIPWDDDMDICVPIEYWDKFLLALDKDLDKEKFYYHCYEKDSRYNVLNPDMKIRLKGTYCLEKNDILMPNRCEGNGIFIDIIKYGPISNDLEEDKHSRELIKKRVIPLCLNHFFGVNNTKLKQEVREISDSYFIKNKDSSLISQSISYPWVKKGKEPIFKKEDVYPFKLYDFEGRQYYSYNNLKEVLIKWYGENSLRKYDEKLNKWVDDFPFEKRINKHYLKINLNGDRFKKKRKD